MHFVVMQSSWYFSWYLQNAKHEGLHVFSKSPYSVLTTLDTRLYFIYRFLELSALHCYSYGGILVRKWGKHTDHVHYSRYFFWQWDIHTVWLIYFCHSKGNSPSSNVVYIDPELLSSKVPSVSWIKNFKLFILLCLKERKI